MQSRLGVVPLGLWHIYFWAVGSTGGNWCPPRSNRAARRSLLRSNLGLKIAQRHAERVLSSAGRAANHSIRDCSRKAFEYLKACYHSYLLIPSRQDKHNLLCCQSFRTCAAERAAVQVPCGLQIRQPLNLARAESGFLRIQHLTSFSVHCHDKIAIWVTAWI